MVALWSLGDAWRHNFWWRQIAATVCAPKGQRIKSSGWWWRFDGSETADELEMPKIRFYLKESWMYRVKWGSEWLEFNSTTRGKPKTWGIRGESLIFVGNRFLLLFQLFLLQSFSFSFLQTLKELIPEEPWRSWRKKWSLVIWREGNERRRKKRRQDIYQEEQWEEICKHWSRGESLWWKGKGDSSVESHTRVLEWLHLVFVELFYTRGSNLDPVKEEQRRRREIMMRKCQLSSRAAERGAE